MESNNFFFLYALRKKIHKKVSPRYRVDLPSNPIHPHILFDILLCQKTLSPLTAIPCILTHIPTAVS